MYWIASFEVVSTGRGSSLNKVVYAWYSSAEITLKGIEFLEEIRVLAKTYRGIKEVRYWLKLY